LFKLIIDKGSAAQTRLGWSCHTP